MAINITQLRRLVLRKWDSDGGTWDTPIVISPSELGQDTIMTFNIAPRTLERASQQGTTTAPIEGTFDELSASITFLADTWEIVGRAWGRWNTATYEGVESGSGNIIGGSDDSLCSGGEYYSVIAQGVCDDGSSTDVEFTRCLPAIEDDIEIGTSETPEVTLNLHPQIYNSVTMSSDGYPKYTFRLGDNSLTVKQRLNVTTGEYAAAGSTETTSSETTSGGEDS